MLWVEILGTGSSVIIAISLMQKNIRWLRTINSIGALLFTVYGVIIASVPVVLLNSFIVLTNLVLLYRLRFSQDQFDFILLDEIGATYIEKFVQHHKADIALFMPEFKREDLEESSGCFILRNTLPVALIAFKDTDEHSRRIVIDYAIPMYRDYRNSRYFMQSVLKPLGFSSVQQILATGTTKKHQKYLERLGFVATAPQSKRYALTLDKQNNNF